MKIKILSIYFALIVVLLGIVSDYVFVLQVNQHAESIKKLNNEKNLSLNWKLAKPTYDYFVVVYYHYLDILDRYKVNFDKINSFNDLDFKYELVFIWNQKYDSEFFALKKYLSRHKGEYTDPNSGIKSDILLNRLELLRLASLEAKIFTEQKRGSIFGGLVKSLMSGVTLNFTFFDSKLHSQVTNFLAGEGTTDYYMYLETNLLLHLIYSIIFALGLLLPYYLISIIVIKK
jgi:hypothetical protein